MTLQMLSALPLLMHRFRLRAYHIASVLVLALLIITTTEAADSDKIILDGILDSTDRDIAHLLRDDSRQPGAVISFVGVQPGMKILDIYAADGYYTYLLSRLVGPEGEVYAQNPPAGSNVEDIRQMYSLADSLDERIRSAALINVRHLREGILDLSVPPGSLDLILLAQILHDFYNSSSDYAIAVLSHLRTLLKPGGTLAIIDHAGDQGQDNARLHRMQKDAAIAVTTQAGFTFTGDSSVLANPADPHRRPVFDPMLGRNTDRFLLRFAR